MRDTPAHDPRSPGTPLVPRLGRRAWVLLAVNCVSNAGSGLVLPFLIVYLHAIRGMPLDRAGFVLSLVGVAGIASTPLAGVLGDRVGGRLTFVVGLVLFAVGTVGFIPVHSLGQAVAPAVAFGAAGGLTWLGLYAMIGEEVPPEARGEAFGVRFALAEIGIAVGALIGGFVIDLHSAGSFVPLLLADAATDVLFAFVLVAMGPGRQVRVRRRPVRAGGYRRALSDRALLGAAAVNVLLVTVGSSQMTSAFPAWATGPAGASPRVVGAAFTANMVVLGCAQLVVLRMIKTKRRSAAAAVGAVLLGLAWIAVLAGGNAGGGALAAGCLVGGLAVVGLAQTLVSPTLPAMVNDLAPEPLRGRYNAVFTLSEQVGPVIGPAISGVALGRGYGDELFVGLSLACLLGAAAASSLRRIVPQRADRPAGPSATSSE